MYITLCPGSILAMLRSQTHFRVVNIDMLGKGADAFEQWCYYSLLCHKAATVKTYKHCNSQCSIGLKYYRQLYTYRHMLKISLRHMLKISLDICWKSARRQRNKRKCFKKTETNIQYCDALIGHIGLLNMFWEVPVVQMLCCCGSKESKRKAKTVKTKNVTDWWVAAMDKYHEVRRFTEDRETLKKRDTPIFLIKDGT